MIRRGGRVADPGSTPASPARRVACARRESDKAEIDAAIQGLHARGLSTEEDLKGLTKEDFPLPTFGVRLVELGLNVSHGRGFQLIKCVFAGCTGAAAAALGSWRWSREVG